MRNTIEMAREAGLFTHKEVQAEIKAFEALVRADQDEKYKWDIHSCGPICTKAACIAIREAVAAEREACAKVCESEWSNIAERMYGQECADTIRARGENA